MGIVSYLKDLIFGKAKDKVLGGHHTTTVYNSRTTESNSSSETLDSRYDAFPVFSTNPSNVTYKSTDKYMRCSLDFNKVTNEEVDRYIMRLSGNGFSKKTDVRYEKDNTYVIVDKQGKALNIVYHIKN